MGGGGALGTVAGCVLCVSGARPPSEAKLGGMVGGGIGVVDLSGWRGGVMGLCGGASGSLCGCCWVVKEAFRGLGCACACAGGWRGGCCGCRGRELEDCAAVEEVEEEEDVAGGCEAGGAALKLELGCAGGGMGLEDVDAVLEALEFGCAEVVFNLIPAMVSAG